MWQLDGVEEQRSYFRCRRLCPFPARGRKEHGDLHLVAEDPYVATEKAEAGSPFPLPAAQTENLLLCGTHIFLKKREKCSLS